MTKASTSLIVALQISVDLSHAELKINFCLASRALTVYGRIPPPVHIPFAWFFLKGHLYVGAT